MKLSENRYIEAAKKVANSLKKTGVAVPSDVINPGLYVGFILGCRYMESEVNTLRDAMRVEQDMRASWEDTIKENVMLKKQQKE